MWVKFSGLPLPCWSFIESIAKTLGKVVTMEPEKFFNDRPQQRVCVEVDLSKDLKDAVEIQIGAQTFSQKVLYLNLPNTYYRCQSAEHKIWDCPLVTPRVKPAPKEAPVKPAEGKKEEWVTVGRKGKVTLNPLPPKQSYTVVAAVPPIPTGASTPASVGTQAASTTLILGVSQVSNPAHAQGIKAAARASPLVGVRTPLAASSIAPPATRRSRSPPGRAEAPEVKRQAVSSEDFPSDFHPASSFLHNSYSSLEDEDDMEEFS